MGGGKRVVDVDVAIGGKLSGEGRVVLFLALVEAGVFEQQDVAVLHGGNGAGGLVADAVGGKGDRAADAPRDVAAAIGASESAGSGPSLGRPKWASRMTLAPLPDEFEDGRGDALDAGGVGDLAVGHRHVEVDADQHPLAADVADGVECPEAGHGVPFP